MRAQLLTIVPLLALAIAPATQESLPPALEGQRELGEIPFGTTSGPDHEIWRYQKVPGRPGQSPDEDPWEAARVEWQPVAPPQGHPELHGPYTVQFRGRLLWRDPDFRWKPVDWLQGVRLLVARNPATRLDWSRGHDHHDTIWTEVLLEADGTFAAQIPTVWLNLCVGVARSFQVGLVPAIVEGDTVTWLDATPVLSGSLGELAIRGPEPLGETLQRINAAPGVYAETFEIDALIRAVNHLHGLGKEGALDALEEFLVRAGDRCYGARPRDPARIDTADDNGVFLIVRLLFEPAEDQWKTYPYPWVGLGEPQPRCSDEFQARWPHFPLVVVEDVPLLIVSDYAIAGIRQLPIVHVRWARKHGKLRETPLRPGRDPVGAVEALLEQLKDPGHEEHCRRERRRALLSQVRATIGDLLPTGRWPFSRHDLERWWAEARDLSEKGTILWDEERQLFVRGER